MRTAAILPVKSFGEAKQRLRESVAEELRARLAAAMVADVLRALARTAAIERTVVVTREPSVAAAARAQGATVVEDRAEAGQSAAAALGIERALADGLQRALCVPGDCPALDPDELELLLASGERREVVVVPDRHGTGTNGLLLAPPDAIAPSFGPGSFARHRALAAQAGMRCRVERTPSLLLDVDTGADLQAMRERLGEVRELAHSTRAALASPAAAHAGAR